jgi:hypothetical protein
MSHCIMETTCLINSYFCTGVIIRVYELVSRAGPDMPGR